jgi:drug/metabolite transporter (DMT)-like permease
MVSLLVHAILGVVVIAVVVKLNPAIFKRVPDSPALSTLEIAYWVVGIASLPLCWYFNIRYVYAYAADPFWGQGNWNEFIAMGYANYASSSQVADYTLINVILLPLFTIADGRRRGIRHPWLFLVSSFFTSCAFAFAFYFATVERQRRHKIADIESPSPV